jgi:AraC-like DNA-binding protein
MPNLQPQRIRTISEYHRAKGLSTPEHPLISLVDYGAIRHEPGIVSMVFDFYSIALKRNPAARIKYGQQDYDFDEGVMFFIAPGQVFSVEVEADSETPHSGWILLIHPDLLWNTNLAKTIRRYEYFDYSVAEALFLSEKEEATLVGIMQAIRQEYRANIDGFSQNIIIAQLELLLSYAERFYHRQFITRKITNSRVLGRLEDILTNYFNSDALLKNGLPTVQYIAETLNISPNYLSALLKVLTGQSTQQHIHGKLIEKAKEKLSTTDLSVNEIAYELGFEYPQSFSKLFKTKTSLSPLAFRQSFN